ncbi:MAG: hypothetical protein ABJ251_19350 [Paracoccaceae bacterium]
MSTDKIALTTIEVNDALKAETDAAGLKMSKKDTANLLEEIARREAAAEKDAAVLAIPSVDSPYATAELALGDDLKEIGDRLIKLWVRKLHGVICGGSSSEESRKKIASFASLDDAAAIAAVTALLLPITSPVFAAPAAVIIVREFLGPAAEELCDFWAEKLKLPLA